MIIDCHGHYTTAPKALERGATSRSQAFRTRSCPKVADLKISDDELRESIESNQLRLMQERGSDIAIFAACQFHGSSHLVTCRSPAPGRPFGNELCFRVTNFSR